MLGIFGQKSWFEDLSDTAVMFSRWTHDEDPAASYAVVIVYDPEASTRAGARNLSTIAVITAEFAPSAIVRDQMPDGAVVMQLRSALDDRFVDTCARGKVKATLLATQTGGGTRHYFLLTNGFEALQATVSTVVPPANVALKVWERGDLSALLTWLEPSRLESWEFRDDQVRRVFAEHGDQGATSRDARFFFYGGDPAAFAEAAVEAGFKIEGSSDLVILSQDMPITRDAMNALNATFSEWVDAFGVDYDGWEAAMLVKN